MTVIAKPAERRAGFRQQAREMAGEQMSVLAAEAVELRGEARLAISLYAT